MFVWTLCPASCFRSSNAEIRLGAGHWVLGRPALSDRQIPLKNSARQCSSYFQIACAKNKVETAFLEIGKVRVAAVLGQFTLTRRALRRARPATDAAPARARLDSAARPRVALVRVATAARAGPGCCCGASPAAIELPVPIPLDPEANEGPPAPPPTPMEMTTTTTMTTAPYNSTA